MQTLRTALPYRQHFIGVGLVSTEIGYPPELFRDVFAAAAAEGLHRVAHAGEEAGPDYVWQALDLLGAERIDHGIRSMEDASLIRRLREGQVPLTVCRSRTWRCARSARWPTMCCPPCWRKA
jgi:adenosine deaminase